jgi:hypoxanthine phosphoribosyltransferase
VRVEELARMAVDRLPSNFVIVGLLVGSFVFIADFIRALHRFGCNPIVEFIRLSSFVRLIGELELDLAGRAVLPIDDIGYRAHDGLRMRPAPREESVEHPHLCAC